MLNEMTLLQEIFATFGVVGVLALLALYAIKVFMSKMSDGSLNIKTNNTQIELINTLRDEIERIREDFNEMKEEYSNKIREIELSHLREKQEWCRKLEVLEIKFEFLKRKNESMRSEALEAYTYIATREDLFTSTYANDLKERLMRIIADDTRAQQ